MARKDILLDDDLIPVLENGDFLVGDSEQQHIDLILKSSKGDFRLFPLVGVGLADYINAPASAVPSLKKQIRLQLEADGIKTEDITVNRDGDHFTYNIKPKS